MVTMRFVPHSVVRIFANVALAFVCLAPQLTSATVVRMEISFGDTPVGNIDIELLDDQIPTPVRNFLNYAGRHAYQGGYSNTIIHRNARLFPLAGAPIFAIQGGGHTYFPNPFVLNSYFYQPISKGPPIRNEASPTLRPNIQGAISMALSSGQPDSATSEWFINVTDNPLLDDPTNNGGYTYTVFGHVIAGMDIVNTIAALPIFDGANKFPFYYRYNPPQYPGPPYFLELPTHTYDPALYVEGDPATYLQPSNLVFVSLIPNVRSTVTLLGALATFTTDVDVTFNSALILDPNSAAALLASFSTPSNSVVQFNDGVYTLDVAGATGSRVVTLYDGAATRPTRYYAYGPTPGNATPHWYDFTFDGTTGAEILPDRIVLHFVDGQRGDDDLTANGSITHTGAPAVETSADSKSKIGGCTIAQTPPRTGQGGEWGLIAMFLAFAALVRKRDFA